MTGADSIHHTGSRPERNRVPGTHGIPSVQFGLGQPVMNRRCGDCGVAHRDAYLVKPGDNVARRPDAFE